MWFPSVTIFRNLNDHRGSMRKLHLKTVLQEQLTIIIVFLIVNVSFFNPAKLFPPQLVGCLSVSRINQKLE